MPCGVCDAGAVPDKSKPVVYPIRSNEGQLRLSNVSKITDIAMFRILDRYIFREVAQSWLGVTMVLLAILLTNQFARVLGDVAKDRFPKEAIFQIIGLTALQYLTILIPIGLFRMSINRVMGGAFLAAYVAYVFWVL